MKKRPITLPLIRQRADGTWERLVVGTAKAPVYEAYDWDQEGWEARQERAAQRRAETMLNTIHCGDARELAKTIPDASVDLIFTDPVYQNVEDYAWLAQEAQRVLAPKGLLLAWCSKPKMARCQIAMEDTGLAYVYTLDYTVVAKTFRMRWYNLFCWTTPCLWFQKAGSASRPRRWIPDNFTDTIILNDGDPVEMRGACGDTFVSTAGPSGSYVWNKNLGVLKAWLDAFCPLGGLVWDPFTGSGSVPVVAKMLGRNFIASEIQADVARQAQRRVEDTPVPLAFEASPATIEMELAS